MNCGKRNSGKKKEQKSRKKRGETTINIKNVNNYGVVNYVERNSEEKEAKIKNKRKKPRLISKNLNEIKEFAVLSLFLAMLYFWSGKLTIEQLDWGRAFLLFVSEMVVLFRNLNR